jgi:hypothetical protein
MAYKSPLYILDSLQIAPDELNHEGVDRLRKKLLSEFNLNAGVTISVNGNNYTKDAILKIIDQLKDVEDLALHKDIFSKKPLLNWLENPTKEAFPEELWIELLEKNKNNDALQNILQESVNESIKFNFKKNRFAKVSTILRFISLMDEPHRMAIYEKLYVEIKSVIDAMEEAITTSKANLSNQAFFGFISSPDWTDFLNNLPEQFEQVRDNYCFVTLRYLVAIHQKYITWTYEISFQLKQTLCSNIQLRRKIAENHHIFTQNYNNLDAGQASGSSDGGGSGIVTIITLIFIIFRIISCAG